MSFLFSRKEHSEKDDAANRQEFDQLADTIKAIYDLAEETPRTALDEVKSLLHRVKVARTLDKRQRAILNAFAHDTAGFIYLELKRPEEALSEMEKALRTYGVLQDKTPLVNNYLNQSRAWMMRNDLKRTFSSLERGLETAKANNLPRSEADVLYKLGVLYSLTDKVEKAQEAFRHGLLLTQQLGDRAGSATFLAQLGQLNMQLEELDKAEDYLLSSLAVFEEHKLAPNLLQTCDQLVQLYRRKEDYPKALDYANKGLELARARQDQQEEIDFLQDLAMVCYLQKDHDGALRYGEESLALAEQLQDAENKMRACSLLAQIALLKQDFKLAQQYAETGFALAQDREHRREQAVFLNDFAEIRLEQGDTKTAMEFMDRVGAIFREIGDLPTLAALCMRMGDLYLDKLHDPQGTARQAEIAFDLCKGQPGETGMFAFTSALRLLQLLAERGHYTEGLESAGRCLNAANGELQARMKERKNGDPAQQGFWLLFVQVLMVMVATLQDLKSNQTTLRPKVDEVLVQLKERFGDTFTLDEWTAQMYAKIPA